jgi:DNA-binding CsgD family transcriptional regulator
MQQLGNFLLKLWSGALEKPADEFKDWALSEVKTFIPFDYCAWGTGRWINEMPVVHHIHLHNLPGSFIESWLRIQHEYKLTRDVAAHSNRTFNVDMAREYQNTDTYNVYCKEYRIEHILGTGCINPDTGLLSMMVFHRSDINQPFTEAERALKEIIFQHLLEAARMNWLMNLPNGFSGYSHSSINTLAACDNTGLLHVAMPAFVDICRKEWPSWKGPFVHEDVLKSLRDQSYIGLSIAIRMFKMNELTLLRARTKVPADKLSSRELEIAQHISEGDDYKTIALNLDISPATVKTHTSKIYLKLGINDKAQLAVELGKLCI